MQQIRIFFSFFYILLKLIKQIYIKKTASITMKFKFLLNEMLMMNFNFK